MDFKNLVIEKIEIKQFKKIRNLCVEPGKRCNLFLGSSRSGKTSLCEFVQFALYGADAVSLARDNAEDAMGSITFSSDNGTYTVERNVISGNESFFFYKENKDFPVETNLTPGEFLTGMDLDTFDLISYHRQAKYEAPISRPRFSILNQIASISEETHDIYRDLLILKEKRRAFCNEEKDGALDVLLKKEEELNTELSNYPLLLSAIEDDQAAIGEIREKIDDNERQCVLLKAQMAEFSDELKLLQNKENAEDLHRKILAGEKKLKILNYELNNKIGKLSKHDLNQMKQDYNKLSLSAINLNEARTALSAAQENLTYHENLFKGKYSRENLDEIKKSLNKKKTGRLLICILGTLLLSGSAALGLFLHHKGFDLITTIGVIGALLLCGIATLCLSTLFTASIEKILAKLDLQNVPEFNELYEKVCAHSKTTQVYREELANCESKVALRKKEKDQVIQRISQKIKSLGYDEKDGEILAICDDIIEANDTFYDLEVDIDLDKAEYKRMLSGGVEDENATISEEFLNLQNKLNFLTAQNDALYKKKAVLKGKIQEAQEKTVRSPEVIEKELASLNTELIRVKFEFESADMNYALAKAKKDKFESDLKKVLTKKINERMKFLLSEGESFLFDEEFELCFCDQNSVLPLVAAGGGVISEIGLIAFRIALAELMGKTGLPMIFDDSLAGLSLEDSKEFFCGINQTCSQFFIATSLQEHAELCDADSKVIVL